MREGQTPLSTHLGRAGGSSWKWQISRIPPESLTRGMHPGTCRLRIHASTVAARGFIAAASRALPRGVLSMRPLKRVELLDSRLYARRAIGSGKARKDQTKGGGKRERDPYSRRDEHCLISGKSRRRYSNGSNHCGDVPCCASKVVGMVLLLALALFDSRGRGIEPPLPPSQCRAQVDFKTRTVSVGHGSKTNLQSLCRGPPKTICCQAALQPSSLPVAG